MRLRKLGIERKLYSEDLIVLSTLSIIIKNKFGPFGIGDLLKW